MVSDAGSKPDCAAAASVRNSLWNQGSGLTYSLILSLLPTYRPKLRLDPDV